MMYDNVAVHGGNVADGDVEDGGDDDDDDDDSDDDPFTAICIFKNGRLMYRCIRITSAGKEIHAEIVGVPQGVI